jgi:hypothetical protein
MILDAFGIEAAGPLLAAGALGGLVRGIVVFRSVIAKGPVTTAIAVATVFDTGTSIVIGANYLAVSSRDGRGGFAASRAQPDRT